MDIKKTRLIVHYLKGTELIGGLSTGYYSGALIKPAIATVYDENKISKFYFGYGHAPKVQDVFYECPVIIGCLQLYRMEIVEKPDSNPQLLFEATILQNRLPRISVTIELNNLIPHVLDIINFINLYLSYGKESKNLKQSFLKDRENFKEVSTSQLLSIIEDLKFEYFSGETKRVGKDNIEYTGITIKNIPNNSYLAETIIKCVSETSFVEHARWIPEKREIILSTDRRNDLSYKNESKELILNIVMMKFFVHYKFSEHLVASHDQQNEI